MADRYTKQLDGQCPYCGGTAFGPEQDRRPVDPGVVDVQRLSTCDACGKWSMRHTPTGVRYPLQDPDDSTSPPAQAVIVG